MPWRVVQPSVVCFLAAFAIAAFHAGFTRCSDCKTFGDRVFMGCIWIGLGIFSYGRIPLDALANRHLNLWPRALIAWVVLLAAWFGRTLLRM